MADLSTQTLERLNGLVNSDKFNSLAPETQTRIKGLLSGKSSPSVSSGNAPSGNVPLGDLAFDAYARAGMGAYNALSWLPGVKQLANITPGRSADELSKGIPRGNIGQQIASGTGAAAGTIPFANPFIRGASMVPVLGRSAIASGAAGFGAFEGAKKAIEGKPQEILPAAAQGAASGAVFGMGGRLGSQFMPKVIPGAERIGTALGSAAAGAATAPKGEKVSGAIIGGGLGALNPVKRIPEKTYDQKIDKFADVYRQVLAPSKGDINRVEIRSGKNLDDYYKLAAKEGIIIKVSPDNKLDTAAARGTLQQKSSELNQQINDALASNKKTQFNLMDVAKIAKINLRKNIKNDTDFKAASKIVDNEIADAISERGNIVNGQDLNAIKQGMWSKGYDPLNPNSKSTAREIGFVAKDMIEKAFPNKSIKDINSKLGEYLTLDALLDSAHGRVIAKGKLGRYFAEGTGALIGAGAGSVVPILGTIGGGLAGRWAGGKFSDFLNNPERITSSISNKVSGLQDPNKKAQYFPGNQSTNFNPVKGLPAPAAPLPQYLQQRQNAPIQSLGPGKGTPNETVIPQKGYVPQGLPSHIIEPGSSTVRGGGKLTPNIPSSQPAQRSTQYPSTPLSAKGSGMNDPFLKERWMEKAKEEGYSKNSDFNPIKKADIPAFKNTNEAAKFGIQNKNNVKVLAKLKQKYESGLTELNKIKSLGENATDKQMSEAFVIAQKNQLYREAYEAATKSGGWSKK